MSEQRNGKVQLGCWTLILIAIIVAMFSGRGDVGDLKDQIDDLEYEVIELRRSVDELTRATEASRDSTPP